MKKKILLLLMFSILFITGCKNVKPVDENNKLVIKDKDSGYTIKFSYPKSDNYTTKEELGGKFVESIIKNEEKNIKMDVYFFESTYNSFSSTKISRKNDDTFKEYNWNNYEGYIYNADKYSLNFNILLKKDNESNCIALFGEVSPINYKDADIVEIFNSKDIQDLFNTIEFSINK